MSHRIFDMREVKAQLAEADENGSEYVVSSPHGHSHTSIPTSHQQTHMHRSGSALSSPRSSIGMLSPSTVPRSLPTDATSVYSVIKRREYDDRPFHPDKRDIEAFPLQMVPHAGKAVDYRHLLSQTDEDSYPAATAHPNPRPAEELNGIGSHVHGAKSHRPTSLDSSIDVLDVPDIADTGDEVTNWDGTAMDMKTRLESIAEERAMDDDDSCSSSGQTRPSRRELAAEVIRHVDQSISLADKVSISLHGSGNPKADENSSTTLGGFIDEDQRVSSIVMDDVVDEGVRRSKAPQKKNARQNKEGEQTE